MRILRVLLFIEMLGMLGISTGFLPTVHAVESSAVPPYSQLPSDSLKIQPRFFPRYKKIFLVLRHSETSEEITINLKHVKAYFYQNHLPLQMLQNNGLLNKSYGGSIELGKYFEMGGQIKMLPLLVTHQQSVLLKSQSIQTVAGKRNHQSLQYRVGSAFILSDSSVEHSGEHDHHHINLAAVPLTVGIKFKDEKHRLSVESHTGVSITAQPYFQLKAIITL
jgi:hypothetical protein